MTDCFKYGFVLLEDSFQSSKFIYIARATVLARSITCTGSSKFMMYAYMTYAERRITCSKQLCLVSRTPGKWARRGKLILETNVVLQ